ncbi:hypothetical protein JCM3765_001943 [Sporobolomyces pararoseus]
MASALYFGGVLEYLKENRPQSVTVEDALVIHRKLAFGSKLREKLGSGGGTSKQHLMDVISDNPLGALPAFLALQEESLPVEMMRSSTLKHRLLIYIAIVTARIDNFLNHVQQLEWDQDTLLHHLQTAVLSSCYSGLSGETSTRACQAVQRLFSDVAHAISDLA